MAARAFICGLKTSGLSEKEGDFLRRCEPWGIILFPRNVKSLEQVGELCRRIRRTLGREDAPILIDQEGGRVQRIRPPHVRAYPPVATYGAMYAENPLLAVEAARLGAKLLALDLSALGINVDCAPVLDVPSPDADGIVGDRAFGADTDVVLTLGGAQIDGFFAGGVLPVMKHIPGHGRANVDSHKALPRVDASLAELEAVDFAPFRLWASKVPLAMTAHVVYTAIDPDTVATHSKIVIESIIRERIGFRGLLMSDDLSMGALSGDLASRAAASIAAGCDVVLHCSGELKPGEAIARSVPELEGDALRRANEALAMLMPPEPVDRVALEARFDALLARFATRPEAATA